MMSERVKNMEWLTRLAGYLVENCARHFYQTNVQVLHIYASVTRCSLQRRLFLSSEGSWHFFI